VVFATFQEARGEKIWEKFYLLESAAKLLGGPPYYLIGSLVDLLIPIGSLFQLQYSYIAGKMPI
jgi:hypothetical protein